MKLSVKDEQGYSHTVENLRGQNFGVITALEPEYIDGQFGWWCKCVCGDKTWYPVDSVRRNNKYCQHSTDVSRYYSQYKANSDRSGYGFDLSRYQFYQIVSGNCHYCGVQPQSRRFGTEDSYSLLGRHNLQEGYTIENSVACCDECKVMKSRMNDVEFYEWIGSVYSMMVRKTNGYV